MSDYPDLHIPNTNNALEALNSDLKAKLNLHKDISKETNSICENTLLIPVIHTFFCEPQAIRLRALEFIKRVIFYNRNRNANYF